MTYRNINIHNANRDGDNDDLYAIYLRPRDVFVLTIFRDYDEL